MSEKTTLADLIERNAQHEQAKVKKRRRAKQNVAARRRRKKKMAERTKEEQAAIDARRREKMNMSQEALAQQELAKRELARRHLLPFIHRFQPNYQAGWFHKDLCLRLEKFLQDVIDEKSPRLMLFVPPRHGKSITASQNFPAWSLGKYPHLEFISTSYAESLQLDFSKQIQQMIRDPEYQLLFPGIGIPKKNEAVARWKIAVDNKLSGGGLLAAGVGGPLTGRGAHIGIIDDPVKNAEEADSEITRAAHKSWYSSTFYTRLAPGAGILVIQTRWHDDDLSGWLLQRLEEAEKEYQTTGVWPADADRWEVVKYAAIATEDEKYRHTGEALHPERYDEKALAKIKRTMIPRHWSALYQQEPVAEEGQYFQKGSFRFYKPNQRPVLRDLDIFAAGDLAISTKESADHTVFVVAGIDKDDRLWILDTRRGRWGADEIVDQIVDIQKNWHPRVFGIEREKVAIAIGPAINRRIREERLYELVIEELHIAGRDKMTRARPLQGRMGQGMVLFPEGAIWMGQLQNELLRFPQGISDDYVDALAWLCQMLADVIWRPRSRKKKKKSWKDKLKKHIAGGRSNVGAMGA